MPGPPPKDPERRIRRNTDANAVEVAPLDRAPEPPAGLGGPLAAEWRALWRSALATRYTSTDLPALRRLFRLRQESARAHELHNEAPLVAGSEGQLVLNPLGRHALALDAEIRQLEDRYGLTPRARLGLGVRIGQVADAVKRHPEVFEEETPERADPRLSDPRSLASHARPPGGGVDGGGARPRGGRPRG